MRTSNNRCGASLNSIKRNSDGSFPFYTDACSKPNKPEDSFVVKTTMRYLFFGVIQWFRKGIWYSHSYITKNMLLYIFLLVFENKVLCAFNGQMINIPCSFHRVINFTWNNVACTQERIMVIAVINDGMARFNRWKPNPSETAEASKNLVLCSCFSFAKKLHRPPN